MHTVLQDLDLSGGRRGGEGEGNDSGRCDSGGQERAHVEVSLHSPRAGDKCNG
jgi:hypothetical protein